MTDIDEKSRISSNKRVIFKEVSVIYLTWEVDDIFLFQIGLRFWKANDLGVLGCDGYLFLSLLELKNRMWRISDGQK
ncbi:hypothetical protein ACJJJB_15870 [Microbulbifer sp. ANSA001]|uniref:hypothetical protein n=1 Tax=Microbulbifer sp. ANSA001 TaxID=3243358 RepID=UPI00404285BA